MYISAMYISGSVIEFQWSVGELNGLACSKRDGFHHKVTYVFFKVCWDTYDRQYVFDDQTYFSRHFES